MPARKKSQPFADDDAEFAALQGALKAFKAGDFSQRLQVPGKGRLSDVARDFNEVLGLVDALASEIMRVAREVGTEGQLGGQAHVPGLAGTWLELTTNVNQLADNLTDQLRDVSRVATAIANGDLSQKITVSAKGEILQIKHVINQMVDSLNAFAEEVTRVAREVGTEGKLGGQAKVRGVSGTWRDLTNNVNLLAGNLTDQVRNIAKVTTAVANGDLTQKITVQARGEILELKNTINTMVDRLNTFAEEVTRVAREVGTEGMLGGQAKVPGVAGTWRDLTDNVNQLAANLTNQVRAIAEVSTAVAQGDLTRQIMVQAEGEVADLKDTINLMIANLQASTRHTMEQDWLKTNIARLSALVHGQKSLETVARLIMKELPPLVSAQYGAFYLMERDDEGPVLRLVASYAFSERKHADNTFRLGQSLVGQAALEKEPILLTKVPPDYVRISSGLGEAPPMQLIVVPVVFEGEVRAVVELASLQAFRPIDHAILEQVSDSLGAVLSTFAAGRRSEELLRELRQSNAALEEKALQLESKNREIELARASLEDKAEQLSLISKYKSDFLSNMSHELRTPLNSMLLLAKLLVDNQEKTLNPRQLEYARTVYAAGTDLLALIDEVLDLSKIEAGKMEVEVSPVSLAEVVERLRAAFSPLAKEKGLEAAFTIEPGTPATIATDRRRLEQVLRNLLSNAIKFTEQGGVKLTIGPARPKARRNGERLADAPEVVAFRVSDTGIGIAPEQHALIWESFRQEDASTTRRFGGTGLGLAISRELTHLLGGEIGLASEPGRGSTFTLYLPTSYMGPSTGPTSSLFERGARPGPVTFVPPVGAPEPERPHAAKAIAVLLVEAAAPALAKLKSLVARRGMQAEASRSAEEAIEALERQRFDALVLDPKLPGMSGFELLDQARERGLLDGMPVIVHSARRLAAKQRKQLERDAVEIVPPGEDAMARLAEALDRVLRPGYLAGGRQARRGRVITDPGPEPLAGKVVLVVDDDVRNIFALTSVLESHQMTVLFTENGPDGLRALQEHAEIDMVLMDVMMPTMDGYETMRRIRALPAFAELPIIALTAKAMKGDREKCLRAGASDYVAKPVDAERLVAVMRRWAGKTPARRATK